MKKILLIVSLIISTLAFAETPLIARLDFKKITPCQDTLVPYLTALNLSNFIGKPIDSFLTKLPTNYTQIKILPGDQLKKAHMLYIRYNANVYLGIIVSKFQYMNPSPPSSNWSISLFRKETVAFIEIYNGINCINGCQ
jgi:hypothetical protein